MGSYQNAVITSNGEIYLAKAIAGEINLTFSHMAISDYAYPAGTDLSALTSLTSVKMTVLPASVWVSGTTVGVRGLFSNTSVSTAYDIETVGVYATDGQTEILFSVSSATTPDEMPAYNGVAPSSFIFTVQETLSQTPSFTISVTAAGVATAADIADLQATKQDVVTGTASTIVSDNLTANRVLVTNGSKKAAVSSVTTTELGRLSGISSNVQEQLDEKQATITGAASTVVNSNFSETGHVLISSATGKIITDPNITSTELNYLEACEGNIQLQINSLKNGKAIVNHQSITQDYGVGTLAAYGHVMLYDGIDRAAYTTGEALSSHAGKTLADNIAKVASTIPNVSSVGVSDTVVASGTATAAGTISLTPGKWIIKATARWNANALGYRQLWLSESSAGAAKDFDSVVSYPAVDGAITSEQLTVFITVSANTTLYLVAQQNSGAGVTLNTRYSLARLGD